MARTREIEVILKFILKWFVNMSVRELVFIFSTVQRYVSISLPLYFRWEQSTVYNTFVFCLTNQWESLQVDRNNLWDRSCNILLKVAKR